MEIESLPEGEAIITKIADRYNKGLLNVIKVIGLPGTGKSWLCMRLAEKVDERLNGNDSIIISNVVDNLLDLLKFVRAVDSPGKVLVIEEAEVLFPARRAMSGDNVDAGKIFDTIRKKRIIVILNYPINKSVDSHIDALSTLQIETLRINKTKGICICKPIRLQTNPGSGKTYHHRLTLNGREVHRSYFRRPSDELVKAYENKKDKFLDDLYEFLEHKQQKKVEEDMKRIGKKVRAEQALTLTNKELHVQALLNQGLNQSQIARKYGVTPQNIYKMVQNIERKLGITMDFSRKLSKNKVQKGIAINPIKSV